MPIPAHKDELLQAIRIQYQKLAYELQSLDAEKVHRVELPGHAKDTQMSIHQLVAYLTGWGQLVLKWHRLHCAEQPIDFPETGYGWNQLGALAQKFYADYANHSFSDLLALFDQTVAEIISLVQAKTNQKLYEQPWYKQYTLGRMIQLNTSSPYQNAYKRLRAWQRANKS